MHRKYKELLQTIHETRKANRILDVSLGKCLLKDLARYRRIILKQILYYIKCEAFIPHTLIYMSMSLKRK